MATAASRLLKWLGPHAPRVALVCALLVAGLAACSQTSSKGAAEGPSPPLEGTKWRLVQFKSGDDTIVKPDDGHKYTLEFGQGGQLTTRLDCNVGRSTWSSGGPNQLQLGELEASRAACPAGSMFDQFARQWTSVSSYAVKDRNLFLALNSNGGTYEFEPMPGVGR